MQVPPHYLEKLFCLCSKYFLLYVLGNLLGLEKHELYRVRSIVGWISPLNHAVYQMHDFGYDNLPTIAQSMGCFALFILPCILLSVHTLKRYSFSFLGS